jgi:nucleotide-binding universal stress UspA family protein
MDEATSLAGLSGARITGTHVYAAKLHDLRFRQMEGGLPQQYREERELERQRDVHDDLITRGLSIITDSYLDQAERVCRVNGIPFQRRSLEGKNYRALVEEANSGDYDLLVMGSLGLGAIAGSRVGTVCERVVRRSTIDTLVVKEPQRSLSEGPIVVAVDGSPRAYGGLCTAMTLARTWQVPVQVVAAFDPYYHYVAFNRIADVLSEEAGKVFRFQEQEKLHEEIIDSGLARIYEGHLELARGIADDYGVPIETKLLDGKPHDAIEKHLRKVNPSLLVLGKLGIHADPELDIGGNAENLLRNVTCAVLLSQREHRPEVERVADVTTSWTHEAEQRMQRAPSFVRSMARMAILRYAQEHGHTVITEKIVEEATAQLMPGHAEQAMERIVAARDAGELKRPAPGEVPRWSGEAKDLLLTVEDLALRGNLSMRAEKKARQEGSASVDRHHIAAFLAEQVPESTMQPAQLHWQAAALARLMGVPEGFMRDASRERIEAYARDRGIGEVTREVAEQGLAEARRSMAEAMQGDGMPGGPMQSASSPPPEPGAGGKCPFPHQGMQTRYRAEDSRIPWDREAEASLQSVPAGFCRDMTRKAAETIAAQKGLTEVDGEFLGAILKTFEAGAEAAAERLPWDDEARERIQRAPDMVRGMLIKEIEGWTERNGLPRVDSGAVDAVKAIWQERGVFHLDPEDPRGRTTGESR